MADVDAEQFGTPTRSRSTRWMATGLVVVVVLLAGVVVLRLLRAPLTSDPAPTTDVESALALAADELEAPVDGLNPRCETRVRDDGRRTGEVVVLFHGYTNCPAQMDLLADAYEAAGYSVVVPRLPGHGFQDRLTRALSDVGPDDLTQATDDAIDVAAGLGDRVTVVGLSGGGTLAAWAAAHRDEVAEAVLVAPLVVPKVLPEPLAAPVGLIGRVVPDVYRWWDTDLREELRSPPYAYPRFSLRSLAAFILVGRDVQRTPDRTNQLERLVLVVNGNDAAVSNAAARSAFDALVPVTTNAEVLAFPEDLGWRHDLLDPEGENAASLPAIYTRLEPVFGLDRLGERADDSSGAAG